MSGQPTRIMDRGYRRYDGARGGVREAMGSVWKYTVQRVLGVHRLFRFKVLPVLMIALAYVPAMVYVGVTVIGNAIPQQQGAPVDGHTAAGAFIVGYAKYYGGIIAAIVLFAAFVAPDVLCTDRQTGMLGLYFASPLNRWTYLLAKGGAVLSVLVAVTLGPHLLLLIGYSTQNFGPRGFGEWLKTLGRVIAAGLAVGGFHTMISLAISSITRRRAAASGAFVVLVIGTGAVIQMLVHNTRVSLSLVALDALTLPQEMAYRIFGDHNPIRCDGGIDFYQPCQEVSTPVIYAAFAAWVLIAFAVIVTRYRRIEVTR